jgi:surface antigen
MRRPTIILAIAALVAPSPVLAQFGGIDVPHVPVLNPKPKDKAEAEKEAAEKAARKDAERQEDEAKAARKEAERREAEARAAQNPEERCKRFRVKERGTKLVGDVLTTVGGEKAGRIGTAVFSPVFEVGGVLTDAIACQLDPAEQKQAAAATDRAIASNKVGRTVNWKSKTRKGVSGSSTVAQALAATTAPGATCMLVTDVIIVEGEETRIAKRMCRAAGATRFVLAA